MHYFKGCVVLLVTLVYTFQIHGILEINFPSNKVGNYGKSTHMNCTDSPLDVTKGYRWYKDAVIIYNSANGDTGKYKSTHGNNYFTLEITNTQLTDNGVYQCNYDFQDQSHTLEIQAEGSGVGEVVDDKLVLKLTRFYPGTTTISAVLCNGKTITGSPEISSDGGSFFNLLWTSSKIVDTNDLKAGCDVTILSRSTYNIQVSVKIATTTTTFTTPTTTPASTTTTPASTTTTHASIATTTPSTTTTSTLRTTTTPVYTPSTTSLSDKMIIVIVIVPVGVIAVVGMVIFFCLFYRLRRGKRKPASHERHKHGKHYKDDMRSIPQHQQQPYILYGRGRTRQSNHKKTKRLRSFHNDDRYNWYDGYHWGSQIKQNPVYKKSQQIILQ